MSILIENVTKHFGKNIVLDDINLEIKTGSLVALLGGSGSGKSTLLRVVAGFEKPAVGRVWLNGKDSSSLSIQEKEIGFVFQAYALFQHLTVYENIAFGLSCNSSSFELEFTPKRVINWFSKGFLRPILNSKGTEPYFYKKNQNKKKILENKTSIFTDQTKLLTNQNQFKTSKGNVTYDNSFDDTNVQLESNTKTNSEKLHCLSKLSSNSALRSVEELLRLVGLEDLAHRYPNQLSGGQCQRVALARALAVQPKVLLLDEPFGALDTKVRKNLRRWLRQLHERVGVTTLFVTHDHQEAMEVANEIVVLDKGRVLHSLNSPQKIFSRLTTLSTKT